MLDSFYTAIKAIRRTRWSPGASPRTVTPRGGERTRPLVFYRDLFCLRGRKNLNRARCPGEGPVRCARPQPDHPRRWAATERDPSRRRSERGPGRGQGGASGRRARPHDQAPRATPALGDRVLVGEQPPVDEEPAPNPAKQARRIEESLYLYWKGGASVAIHAADRGTGTRYFTGGPASTEDGTPKPALTAFRFPFVAERLSGARMRAWDGLRRRQACRAPLGRWRMADDQEAQREAEAVFNTGSGQGPGEAARSRRCRSEPGLAPARDTTPLTRVRVALRRTA